MIRSVERDVAFLRKELSLEARRIRLSSIPETADLNLPQSAEDDTVFLDGRNQTRKRILLLSPACTVATCTMCPLPNEAIYGNRKVPTAENLIHQFDSAFDTSDATEPEVITVYNNGNFFVDQEIPLATRQHIYAKVRKSAAHSLGVESLPQFIDLDRITEARTNLGNKRLVVSIGLQTSNDLIRKLAINTTCTNVGFERAIELLRSAEYLPIVFLMIKPPFLTEREGIVDAVESIQYLAEKGINEPILCPTRIAPNTIVDILHQRGLFSPPWLWSVVEVLRQTVGISSPRVATVNLESQKNVDSQCASNCPKCNQQFIDGIKNFNTNREIDSLTSLGCSCRNEYEKSMIKEEEQFGNLSIEERVSRFLENKSQ
jgi:hypothetical protein